MKRIFALVLLLAVFTGCLTGCSSPWATRVGSNKPAGSIEVPGKEGVFPRTYIDSMGNKVVIAKRPQRIVIVAFPLIDTMLLLNTPPTASPQVNTFSQWNSLHSYLTAHSIIDLGSQTSVNLEKVLEVEPDLIIGTRANEDIYDDLSKIAPVILLNTQALSFDWRNVPREIGEMIGNEHVAEARIVQLEGLLAQSRDKLSPYKDETFAFLTLADKGTFLIFGKQNYPAYFDMQHGLGLQTPTGYPEKTGRLSLERLADLNPDHIFLMKVPGLETKLAELAKNSIWNSLRAVQKGHVYVVDRSGFTVGILGTEYGIKSVVDILAK